MEFILGVLAGIFLFALMITIAIHIIARRRLKYIETKTNEIITAFKKNVIDSRIEEANGLLFLYNRETNEFLGQGKDLKELNEVVMKRFPNKLFNVPQDELNKFEKVMNNA